MLCLCMLQVERRIAEEGERAQHFLDPSTESRITKVYYTLAGLLASIGGFYWPAE